MRALDSSVCLCYSGGLMKRRQGRPRAGGVVTYVRLPREVRSEVQRRAAADQRSVSAWIRLAIERFIQGGR